MTDKYLSAVHPLNCAQDDLMGIHIREVFAIDEQPTIPQEASADKANNIASEPNYSEDIDADKNTQQPQPAGLEDLPQRNAISEKSNPAQDSRMQRNAIGNRQK